MTTAETIQRPTIAMEAIESKQLAAIGHDAATNTLAIQFRGWDGKLGSTYHYANFTAEDFKAFQAAESKGSHFGKNIKPFADKYPYKKVS